jgi:hypothetical protein
MPEQHGESSERRVWPRFLTAERVGPATGER